jgi:clan AA aspartic protease
MGLTVLEIQVGNPANPDATQPVEFLVDSGAIYSVVPAPILEHLQIKPLAEQSFRLADGSKIVRKKGVAIFKYQDHIGGADVIFGEEGDATLLGAFTLEALGLVLDPFKRELKPLPMILARCFPNGTYLDGTGPREDARKATPTPRWCGEPNLAVLLHETPPRLQ